MCERHLWGEAMSMSPRLMRPRATGFNPKSISGLQAWYDAADSSTLFQNSDGTSAVAATDDPVGYWGDKSGNGRNLTQTTNNNRPLYKPASRNGKGDLLFDGTDDKFAVTSASRLDITNDFTCIAMLQNTSGSGSYLSLGRASGTNGITLYTNAGVDDYRAILKATAAWATDFVLSPNPVGRTSPRRVVVIRNGAATTLGVSGFSEVSITGSAGPITYNGTQLQIGGPNDGHWAGNISEILIWNKALSASERTAAQNYISKKWGL